MASWADQVLSHEALRAEAKFPKGHLILQAEGEGVRRVQAKIITMRALARLHLIARAVDSDYVLNTSATLDEETLGDIDLVFALLERRRLRVNVSDFKFNAVAALPANSPGVLALTNDLTLVVQGEVVGEIPIAIELRDFKVDRSATNEALSVGMAESSEARVYNPIPENLARRGIDPQDQNPLASMINQSPASDR